MIKLFGILIFCAITLTGYCPASAQGEHCQAVFLKSGDQAADIDAKEFKEAVDQTALRNESLTYSIGDSITTSESRPVAKKLLASVWRKNGMFKQQEFYDSFMHDTGAIEQVFNYWYPKRGHVLNDFKKALPPHQLAAALDPALIGREADFLRFAQEYNFKKKNASIANLRAEYSKMLGFYEGYRILELTEKQLVEFQVRGIRARNKTFEPYKSELIVINPIQKVTRLQSELETWTHFVAQGPLVEIQDRIHLGGMGLAQSITKFPEVGIFATKAFGQKRGKIYIFKLRIPALDVITNQQAGGVRHQSTFESEGKTFRTGDNGVEDFVIGNIKPEWITDVTLATNLK